MSYVRGIGIRVRDIRSRLGLTVVQFAEKVSCQPKLIEIIEQDGILHENNALAVLDRIAQLGGTSADVLLFHDTRLADVTINQRKLQAFEIILNGRMTKSLDVLNNVFDQIEGECEAALAEQAGPALAFREQGGVLEQITEDRVFDMVVKARKSLE
jgi:transcriptional regulator with XRE-family HTH domain